VPLLFGGVIEAMSPNSFSIYVRFNVSDSIATEAR
jgi:hypothetical protein